MESVIKIVRKYWGFVAVVIIFVIPLGINIAFKIQAVSEWFSYEEQAGDIINFYASILSTIGTVFLGIVAYKQNELANKMNERLLSVEEASKKSYVLLDEERSYFNRSTDTCDCVLVFKKIVDVPVAKWDIVPSDKELVEGYTKARKITVNNVAQIINLENRDINTNIVLSFFQEECFVLSFKLIMTSIYGYRTVQLFSIAVNSEKIVEYVTIENEE